MSSSEVTDERTHFPLISVSLPPNCDFEDHGGTFGLQMALIHNVYIRCLNNIYYYAPRVKKGDEADFAGYCLAFSGCLHTHHHGEEEIVFPFLQTKFDMTPNIDQHGKFTPGLIAFEQHMQDIVKNKDAYDGEKVRQLVEGFGNDLVQHLHDEIPTISPERLGMYDKTELDAVMHRHLDYIKTLSLTIDNVIIATHHDFQAVPLWPPQPPPIKWFVKNIGYWRYRRYWKFASFTRNGETLTYA